MNGLEATKVIRQNVALQDLPIIALTAGGFEKDRDQYLQAGMNDYLSKPFHYEELLDVLYRNLPVPLKRVN
jgi:CheY-like chemotaxis protein